MYTQKDSYNVEANQTDYSELNLFGEKMNNQELLSSSKSLMKSSEDMNKEVASSILTNIFPSLQAIWIETASLSFGISGDEAHRNAAVNVIEIMELLLRFSRADFITQIYQYLSSPGPVSKPVATLGSYQIFLLLRSFFLYFPFSKTGSQPNSLVRADISLISITSTLATQLTSFAPINSDVFTDLMSEIRSWFDLVSFHVSESFDSLIVSLFLFLFSFSLSFSLSFSYLNGSIISPIPL
ncbi:hypothetical protein AX774_g8188 [Zancudomyces culisetae]|uniref:Uncharacterized protein n=1 Tax=Zancudomyces culisetae TaxID=1213189 RepID=A0A1R1PBS8_ZANCU|nr:hypothetical protein AX774_g8188 [Zancudomyces culisetae]|eukprot:OMH78427.1 hypothetical protein AX774_g8188 [Zancudomyces culisetae]